MKCRACGYTDYDPIPEVDKTLEKFINLVGVCCSFKAEDGHHSFDVMLFACPVCGTVRVDNDS